MVYLSCSLQNAQSSSQRNWHKIMNDYFVTGKFKPELILTHCFKLEKCNKVYDAFNRSVFDQEKDVRLLKCFLETPYSDPRAEGTPALTSVPQ